MTKSGRNPRVLTWSIASVNDAVTSVLAGPVNPMWLSEICTNRRALASAAAAAAAAVLSLSWATWLTTSPPATVRTTAEPNQPGVAQELAAGHAVGPGLGLAS